MSEDSATKEVQERNEESNEQKTSSQNQTMVNNGLKEREPQKEPDQEENKSNKTDASDEKGDNEAGKKEEGFGKKFEDKGLWEQLRKYTDMIEVNCDRDFYWPEKRENTEKVIQELLEKRVLFIRSVSEEWLYLSVQRLASVLLADRTLEYPLLRIARSNLSAENTASAELEFDFWGNQRRLSYPVIVVIPAGRQDFMQKFLNLRREIIASQVIKDLKKANLFIVCEVENNTSNKALFDQFQNKIKTAFAVWNVPVLELHLARHLTGKSEAFLQELKDRGLMEQYGESGLFERLQKIDLDAGISVSDDLCRRLEEVNTDIAGMREKLIKIMEGEDFISQIVVFCGAFFDDLYYPDFRKLVTALLQDEKEEVEIAGQAGTSSPDTARKLAEIWEKNAHRILKNCLLETKMEAGNSRVSFVIPQLSGEIARYIKTSQFAFFYRVYKNFEKSGMLMDVHLSKRLEANVVRFFVLVTRMDISTHNAAWLKNIVYEFWSLYKTNLDDYKEYGKFGIPLKKIVPIIVDRIPLIIGELLRDNNAEYKEIVQRFFQLLLNESKAKRMAIVIASYLYKEYKSAEIFAPGDLIGYFKRTLEEGDWEETFFAYDALVESINYKDLLVQTKQWINDEELKEDSWTKRFSFLYQVDYILETVYRYFRQFKAKAVYELWETEGEGPFPDSFKILIKDLLSERSFNAINSIFINKDGTGFVNKDAARRFVDMVNLFEVAESRERIWIKEQFKDANGEPFTLFADVLETWFYILTHKQVLTGKDAAERDRTKEYAYASMIVEYCNVKHLRPIQKFWSEKIRFYSFKIKYVRDRLDRASPKNNLYLDQLKKSQDSLKILATTIHEIREKNLK